ncbi:MAG: hypothetical protein HDS53_04085 [Barnesiella sp.]|nr:hypothetical protein [Barnesiella sp.]
MITEKVINQLYKTYNRRPESADELDIGLLFENLIEHHDIEIDDEAHLIINSLPPTSPFHKLSLSRIHAIVEFEHKVAIILHSSIVFLNKNDNRTHVHIRNMKASVLDKIFGRLNEA